MRALVLVALLAGCVTEVEGGEDQPQEWRSDIDDGFGYACVLDETHVITPCFGADGHTGTCAAGVCRRTCDGNGWANQSLPTLCPDGQHAELGPGGESDPHSCFCMPNQKPWRSEYIVPVPIAAGTGRQL